LNELQYISGVGPATADKLYRGGYEDIEDVASADPSELSNDCGLSLSRSEAIIDSANELLDDEDFEKEEGLAWRTVVDETKRQHDHSIGMIKSMMQRIGIIMAFTPLLFIEAVKYAVKNEFGIISLIFLGASFFVGMLTLLKWELCVPSTNTDVKKLSELYDYEEWIDLQNYVLDSALKDHTYVQKNEARMRVFVFTMIIFLLIGVLFLATTVILVG